MIAGVASIGNGADTLHYAYRPGLDRLATATWRNSQNAELNSRTYAYDTYHRLTGINLNNVSEVTYTLNAKDQRTAASYAVGGAWSYSYDEKSQVTGATGNNTTYSYTYDGIGNRLTAAENSNTWSYTSNLLNQYTAINSNQPTYDADGNMLTTGDGWLYTWNGENRLIRAENSDTLVEMAYDYMGRRIEKKVSSKGVLSFYSWSLEKHYKFAYDGYKLIAIYDAANNNALLMTFTWQPQSVGLDVPVSMTCDGNTYYYVTDGNKNVTGLLDQAGTRVAEYVYGPFGQLLSAEGELADVNPFRFSSEYADDETGLIYYNYRYYSPQLGRWTKRDPIEEEGGVNLYIILQNEIINHTDVLGMAGSSDANWLKEVQEALNNNSRIWYCERKIDPTGLTDEDIQSISAKNIQHAYISIGADPWTLDSQKRQGYGFSSGPKGTLPQPEQHFKPTRCKPCHQRSLDYFNKLSYGKAKGKKCCQASEDEIISCIKNYPARKAYYAPHNYVQAIMNFNEIYVCWDWAAEAIQNCCLSCGEKFKASLDK